MKKEYAKPELEFCELTERVLTESGESVIVDRGYDLPGIPALP